MRPTDSPADTTTMRIVHDALRRDLDRARTALGRPERSSDEARRAVGAHLGWMMRFLHAHHASEDAGLYPFVRARAGRDAEARRVLERMAEDHEAIAPAVAAVEAAAAALATAPSDAAARDTTMAVDALRRVLLPHLRAEEDEAMPLTARLISAREWLAIEKEHNLDPKSTADLGFEGHWLIDGATAEDRTIVLGLVPPIPRFVLLHGFARRYRRHVVACWGQSARPPRRVQLENRVEVIVEAAIDSVWEVVRDVTRVGTWSHECVSATWLPPAASTTPGARFRGRNRSGIFRWGRVCEIISAAPYELVWRTVPTRLYPDSSEWRIALDRHDDGTRISQQFRVVHAPKVLSLVFGLVIPAHRDRTRALLEDLRRLGDVAAEHAAAAGATGPRTGAQTS